MKRAIMLAILGCSIAVVGPVSASTHTTLPRTKAAVSLMHRAEGSVRTDISGYPPGVSAIQPGRQVADRATAAFGKAEVAQFLANTTLLMRGVPGGTPPTLGNVEFLPAVQASARLNGEPIGRADDALVCWVEIKGPLDVSNDITLPSTVRAASPSVPPAAKEILVFDAQTGNLLLSTYGA